MTSDARVTVLIAFCGRIFIKSFVGGNCCSIALRSESSYKLLYIMCNGRARVWWSRRRVCSVPIITCRTRCTTTRDVHTRRSMASKRLETADVYKGAWRTCRGSGCCYCTQHLSDLTELEPLSLSRAFVAAAAAGGGGGAAAAAAAAEKTSVAAAAPAVGAGDGGLENVAQGSEKERMARGT